MAQDYHNFNFAKILLFLFFLSKNIHHNYYPIRFHVTTSISVGVNNMESRIDMTANVCICMIETYAQVTDSLLCVIIIKET